MEIATIDRVEAAQTFLKEQAVELPNISISFGMNARFFASTYWPKGDVLRDKHCCGHGDTLAEAMEKMRAEVELAKVAVKTLKTAAECKAAVIDLIREHDAAPASFRDAVDALPVAS